MEQTLEAFKILLAWDIDHMIQPHIPISLLLASTPTLEFPNDKLYFCFSSPTTQLIYKPTQLSTYFDKYHSFYYTFFQNKSILSINNNE